MGLAVSYSADVPAAVHAVVAVSIPQGTIVRACYSAVARNAPAASVVEAAELHAFATCAAVRSAAVKRISAVMDIHAASASAIYLFMSMNNYLQTLRTRSREIRARGRRRGGVLMLSFTMVV